MRNKEPLDVYQHVTDHIVAAIESNPGEYRMPWQRSGFAATLPRNAHTKALYQGLNTVWLWCAAEQKQYEHNIWASFKQWQQMECQVRAGEKGTVIVFYKQYEVDPNPDHESDDGKRMALKYSHVFNAAQVDGYEAPSLPQTPRLERHELMQKLVAASGATVLAGGDSAYYHMGKDLIQMPDDRCFQQAEAAERTFHYESTLAHELIHATGHKSRLARDMSGRFGSESYCMEELCAETGAAFICAHLGISAVPRADHAQYLHHWLRVMKADKKAIFTAAAKASEATRYLLSLLDKEVAHAA